MKRPIASLTLVATVAALISAGTTASAAGPPGGLSAARPSLDSIDSRLLAPGRVVERIEIGRLGGSAPAVVRVRRVPARKAQDGPVGFDVESAAESLAASSVESCWYARPVWRRYNGFGNLSSKAWYYMEWCGRSGKVTRVMTLTCGGVAAQGFSYDGCRIRRGSTGYSRVNVSGTWLFPFRVGPYTIATRTVTVRARHYGSGYTAGTWWMYQ